MKDENNELSEKLQKESVDFEYTVEKLKYVNSRSNLHPMKLIELLLLKGFSTVLQYFSSTRRSTSRFFGNGL